MRSPATRSPRRSAPRLARLAFFGTPPVAADTLAGLLDAGHDIAVVVSAPDRRRSRNAPPTPTPVKAVALQREVPVVTAVEDVLSFHAELGIVVAFGQLISPGALARLAMVNVHFSLLPRWRGAAPVERAILAGDAETGVSIMALEAGLDTGPVYARAALEIDPEETAAELTERLGRLGMALLLEQIADGPASLSVPVPQGGEPTYAKKITPAELELDFAASAIACHRLVRVGRAWTIFRDRRLLVRRARLADGSGRGLVLPGELVDGLVATGSGWLELLEVQPEGRAAQPFSAWALGARLQPGERLGR